MRICLDAGHYGKYNQSPANKAYWESEAMWKLTMFQKKYLERYGCEVILTRSDINKDMAVYDRGASSKGCDLFISNHSNAVGAGVDETVDYPVTFVSLNKKGDVLGQKLADCVATVMGTAQKGRIVAQAGSGGADYYGVIRGATAVGVVGLLIEHSFHTNTKSTDWLLSDENLDKLAKAEVETIAEHYGLKLPVLTPESPKEDTEMTYEQFKACMERYCKEQASRPAMQSLEASWAKAKAMGIANDDRPYAPVTRQEAAVMAMRAAEKI